MNRDRSLGPWAVAVAVLAVVLGVGVLPASHAAAGAGLSAVPTFPGSVTLGQTGISASIKITNNNTPPDVASTVCRHDDPAGGPLLECVDAEGIVLTPSCGAQNPTFSFCTAADPNVFAISPSATGSGACTGISFTTVPLNDSFGRYRFDPPPGVHVVLPTPTSACTITFAFDVSRMPTLDRQPGVPGLQTAQIVSATAQSDGGTLAGGQGTTTPVTLSQAMPSIATAASAGTTLGVGQLSDQASVSGLVSPVGPHSVTFRLYGPADPTCTGPPVFTDTQSLVIGADPTSGTAQSTNFTPTSAGTHRWVATYNGDANNAAVSGTCGDATETRTVSQATPTIGTIASPPSQLGVELLTDQATVTGLVNPTGAQTVTFNLYGPNAPTCAGAPLFTSTVPLIAGVAQSVGFAPTDVGVYRWIATYNGDANNSPASGSCGDANESTIVDEATPVIVTQSSPDIVIGSGQLSDQATVTGRVNPIGPQSVSFELFGPDDATCANAPVFTSTVLLSSGVAQSAGFAPTEVGTYRWIATYNGDANNEAVSGSCGDANEDTVVLQATPLIVTLASSDIVIGSGQLSDQVTVNGLVNPIGPQGVTFELFGPDDAACVNAPVFVSTAVLAAGVAQSGAFTPTVSGTYRWLATYDGDVNNESATGTCGDPTETTVVTQATPTIATQSSPDIVIGSGQLSDQATVTGLVTPIGPQLVTFELFGPDDATCANAAVFTSTVALSNGVAQSGPFPPTTAGLYRWVATYEGDVNNESVSGTCGDPNESAVVAQATPAIVTQASPDIVLGSGSMFDRATVDDLVNPIGPQTVTFQLFGPDDVTCENEPVFSSTATVSNGVAQSEAFTAAAAGLYRWVATYDGDVNNESVSGACGDANESTAVAKATPAIATQASPDIRIGGGSLSDQVTVTGLANPTGPQTVTFELFGPDDATCANEPAFMSSAVLSAGVAQSGSFTPTATGVYRWIASYGGDINNTAVSGACDDLNESTAVAQATPTITTQASPGIVVGSRQLSDQVTVTSLVSPFGAQTVTFRLYGPSDATCAATPVFTSSVALSSGVAQSGSFTPVAAGSYRWVATYEGDVNNGSASGSCGDPAETAIVSQATPTIATQASPGIVIGSSQLSDHVTVTGLVNPFGVQTVTFRLYGPSDTRCAAAPVFTSSVALSGGVARSGSFTPIVPGAYRWVATYEGDVNNRAVSGTCGDPDETRSATQPPAALPPSALPPAALAPTGSDTPWATELAASLFAIGAVLLTVARRRSRERRHPATC